MLPSLDPLRSRHRIPHLPAEKTTSPSSIRQDSNSPPTGNPGVKDDSPFWIAYNQKATEYDKAIVDQWNQDLESLLVFAGLFSAVLTAFIVEARKGVQEDLHEQTNLLLAQILDTLKPVEQLTHNVPPPVLAAVSGLIWVNSLWLISLSASLASALGSIMAKEWLRQYQHGDHVIPPSDKVTARTRQLRFEGILKGHFSTVVTVLRVLLHASLLTFFAGLAIFFSNDHPTVAVIASSSFAVIVTGYTTITLLPICSTRQEFSFRTPFTGLLRKLGVIFYSLSSIPPQPAFGPSPTLDVRAISFLLRQSASRSSIIAAAKALPQVKLSWEEHARIFEGRGPHILCQIIESTLIIGLRIVTLRPGFSLDDFQSVLSALQHLMPRLPFKHMGHEWPFHEVTVQLGLAVGLMDAKGASEAEMDAEMVKVKGDMVLTYAYLSLGRYLCLRRGSSVYANLDPWSEQAALTTPLMKLIGLAEEHRKDRSFLDPLLILRIVRGLASIGAVLGPISPLDYSWTTKSRMLNIYFDILNTLPLPNPATLHSALLGIEGTLCRELQDIEFVEEPSPVTLLESISNLLEKAANPASAWRLVGGPLAIFSLVRRLHSSGQHRAGDPNYHARLGRAVHAFTASDDLETSFQALATLHHLNTDVPVLDHKLGALQELLTSHGETLSTHAFCALFYALVVRRPALPPDIRVRLIQRCTAILSSPTNTHSTFLGDMIRGLVRLDYTDSEESMRLLISIMPFIGQIAASDLEFEVSLPSLLLIQRFIENLPGTGAVVFLQKDGFSVARAMLTLPAPKVPPPILLITYRVLFDIVGRDETFELDSDHVHLLEMLLNETELLSTIHLTPTIFAQVHNRLEWFYLIQRLEQVIPKVVGTREMIEALQGRTKL